MKEQQADKYAVVREIRQPQTEIGELPFWVEAEWYIFDSRRNDWVPTGKKMGQRVVAASADQAAERVQETSGRGNGEVLVVHSAEMIVLGGFGESVVAAYLANMSDEQLARLQCLLQDEQDQRANL